MCEPVQQGAVSLSEPKTSVHSSKGQVGGDHDGPSLVALAEDLEQQLRSGLGQRDEAELVYDEQLEPGKLLLQVEQPSLVPGLDQLVHQRCGGGEADRQSPLAGCESQAEGDVCLACPAVPTAITFSRRSTYSHRASCMTRSLFTDGMARSRKCRGSLWRGSAQP